MLQTAIIAQRTAEEKPDTEEIRGLTEAAGARIVGEVTQQRPPDPGTELGPGKVDELAELVDETGADTVVVDAELTPQQTVTLEETVGAHVVDRNRVVLEIFADQARTRRAQLQVELARLRYRLPRVKAENDPQRMNIILEKGTRLDDVRNRIDELERKLDDLPSVAEQHREQRREDGFELVALAGYTNAGKSTLLRRLAEEMELDPEGHEDLEETAAVEDRLFKTLETTTRRVTVGSRSALLTDTVGFLDDLPHWLVESFRNTLTAVEDADAVVVVADIAQPTDELRRKLGTVHDALGEDHPPVVTALNKADLVSVEACQERCEAVADLAPNPVVLSARDDDDLDGLESRVCEELTALEETELTLPLTDEAMSLISWLHDEAAEIEVSYGTDAAQVEVAARPATLERARARLERLPA
jgi:GTP-binding protein HflX